MNEERNTQIIKMVLSGDTLETVGKSFGLTKGRVHSIMKKAGYIRKYVKEEK